MTTNKAYVKFQSENGEETEFVSVANLIVAGPPLDSNEEEMVPSCESLFYWDRELARYAEVL